MYIVYKNGYILKEFNSFGKEIISFCKKNSCDWINTTHPKTLEIYKKLKYKEVKNGN